MEEGLVPARPSATLREVADRYIGAQTEQSCENGDASSTAASISAWRTTRPVLADFSLLTVGYT